MQRSLLILLCVCAAAGAACGGKDKRESRRPGGPALAADATRPIATVRGSASGTSLGLLSLRRSGPKVVTVKLRVSASDDTDTFADRARIDLGEDVLDDTISALRLIDEVNGREHFPLRDADGSCLCSSFERIRPGDSVDVYAKFPAPPAGVTRVALHVPGFPSFDGVRIDS